MCREHHKRELRLQQEGIADEELGDVSDMEIDNGFKVPARIWNKLHRFVLLFISTTSFVSVNRVILHNII